MMKNLLMNKKGDVFQVLFMMVMILAIAIIGLIMLVMTTRVNEFWIDSGLLDDAPVAESSITTIQDSAPGTTDYAILFMFLGMNVGVLIAAVRTNFSATVIFLFILLTLIAIMFAAGSVNLYQGFAQQPSIIDVSSELTFTNYLFSKYFPLLISIICGLTMLVMYGKSGADIIS